MRVSRSSGFTLIEVMVALVIVAFGMMAVHTQLNRYVAASTYVEQKTLASWIATNKLTELGVGPDLAVGRRIRRRGRVRRPAVALRDRRVRDGRREPASRRRLGTAARRSRARRAQSLGAHRAPCPAGILAAAVVGTASAAAAPGERG